MAKSQDAEPRSPMSDELGKVFEEHREYLRLLAMRLSGSRATADDLVQETFLRAQRAFPHLRPNSRLKSWLATILANLFRDYNKHEKVKQKAEKQLLAQIEVAIEPPAPEFVDRQLEAAVAQLPPELQRLIRLRGAGKPYKEIADELGMSPGTVASQISRAMNTLRGLIKHNKG